MYEKKLKGEQVLLGGGEERLKRSNQSDGLSPESGCLSRNANAATENLVLA